MLPFQRSLVTGDHRQQQSLGNQDQRRLPEQQSSLNPSPTIVPVADIRVISPQSSTSSPIQKSAKKQASLARIAVPSFSAFKSQASSIPRKPVNQAKTQLDPIPQASPRHFSFAAEPSPRLVHRISRPLSLHGAPTSTDQSNEYDHPLSSSHPVTNSLISTSHAFPHDRNASIDSVLSDLPGEEQRNTAQKSMNGLKPSMTLEFNGVQRQLSNESLNSEASEKRSKSPSRLGAFFGWKSTPTPSKGAESPTTSFSEHSSSPGPSPKVGKDNRSMARLAPAGLDIPRANDARYLDSPDTPIHIGTPEMQTHIQELERELSHISAELAGSIRREMDLEDEVDRLRQELPSVPPSELSRRGSDYFSDSGAGSVRYPISDPDAKIEEVEKSRRKAEQDKAQMKIDVAAKLQTELARRRELEEHVSHLEDQLERRSHEDVERKDRRVEQLEAQLEDVKRKLNQEKEAKQNFEDLYTALQQEFSSGRKFGGRGFSSIAEEGSDLSRAGSLARSGSKRGASLTRSGSVKDREGRGRSGSVVVPLTIESFKEIEDQRDALHKALKLLISRHDKQQKDHERHIKKMTRANQVGSNRQRNGYQREVSHLKEEVTTLRKRTEDALDQKWQYEKSLGGIKMDLDRAEQETRGLRNLLHEHDIAAPSPITMQGRFAQSEVTSPTGILSSASFDRDQAHRLASEFRQRLDMMQQSNASPTQIGELRQAADRMDQLSKQFDRQVNANTALRDRLAAAVEKGEKEQNSSTRQIEEMQKRLATMEDDLLAAQQHSENTLTTHETEVRAIEEATSPRLQRFNVDGAEQSTLKKSPSQGLLRSKTVSHKKVAEATLLDASRTQKLEKQVRELERSLRDAEDDMQYVVQRVNKSQLEVAELTNERDAALIQMRKLQDKLVEETERAEGLMGGGEDHDSGSDYGD